MPDPDPTAASYQRRLPHRFLQGHTLFITWRMHFTLPAHLIRALKEQKEELEASIKSISEDYQALQRYQNDKKLFAWFDDLLSQNEDFPDTLAQPEVAAIIRESLFHWNNNRYFLHAFCIMPNHVHALLTPNCSSTLDIKDLMQKTMYSLKRYTANQINKLLERKGVFWQRESYDHIVRNDKELNRIIEYILFNPVKAKLVSDWQDWPHTWIEDPDEMANL